METSRSTCSGVAPMYAVNTTVYGKSICGSKSVDVFMNETTPRTVTNMMPTKTVNGLRTLIFSNMMSPYKFISIQTPPTPSHIQ
jgi:hypothetical protein